MIIHLICKRFYTNKDLIEDKFGRLYHLPLGLSKLGCKVIVTAIDYRNKLDSSAKISGVEFNTIGAQGTALLHLPYKLYKISTQHKFNFIIASGDSHIGFLSLLIAKKIKAKFIFDVYDYYPVFKGNRIPGMKYMFWYSTKKANLVITASKPLSKKLSRHNRNIVTINNGVDVTLFKNEDKKSSRKYLQLPETAEIIGYFGSITNERGPILIQACNILSKSRKNLILLLAGKNFGINLDYSFIQYNGELPQSELPRYISACDTVTLPYQSGTFNNMAGACKIAEYLACHVPVCATNLPEHQQIFKNTHQSLCLPTAESMAKQIQKQLDSPECVPLPPTLEWNSICKSLHLHIKDLANEKT